MDKNEKYFKTNSFYPAAFLFAKGAELVNIDRTEGSNKAYFVFLDSPEREALLESFNFAPENSSEVMVDARKYMVAIKMLKEKLYQN
jgi:hypothetical protein